MPNSELVYNDLNGEEAKHILQSQVSEILSQVPELQRHIALSRVKMHLAVRLEMAGWTPPVRKIEGEVSLASKTEHEGTSFQMTYPTLEATINSDTLSGGQPPDQIREEYGLPIMEPQRGPFGHQDVPVIRPVNRGGINYAAYVDQDRGGPVSQGYSDFRNLPGQGVVGVKNADRDGAPAPVQRDFKETRG